MDLNLYEDIDCDPEMVETLIKGAQDGMREACIPELTTPSELISAAFTFLDRTLRAVRTMQTPSERSHNAKEISRALNDMIVDHGRVPS